MITETSTTPVMLSDLVKKLLYGSGALSLYHRFRNRHALTVIMFHRVLDSSDARWQSCDPDYTLAAPLFEQCLRFFKRHYNVVSAEQVMAARKGGPALPPRALLVSFDDGWSDNVDHALPGLRNAGLPAVLFVVADAVDRTEPFFQERIISAWRRGTLQIPELVRVIAVHDGASAGATGNDNEALRAAIARLERMPANLRDQVIEQFRPMLDDGLRHMVNSAELQALERGGVTIGSHGKSHVPMTQVEDLDAELGGARAAIAARMQSAPLTMSFPHGRYDPAIAARARDAGYELVFTSKPVLNPSQPQPGWLLGRLGFETEAIVDARGRFRPDLLALYLFRKPQRLLT